MAAAVEHVWCAVEHVRLNFQVGKCRHVSLVMHVKSERHSMGHGRLSPDEMSR